jgi:hypothetical protein
LTSRTCGAAAGAFKEKNSPFMAARRTGRQLPAVRLSTSVRARKADRGAVAAVIR